ncbi:MAG: hypothetical protein OQK82_07680 [Candidatus Pacearchaeota archaeon]|nr:hypothetical protein [Candidatus Pacearchaeota archaeon]
MKISQKYRFLTLLISLLAIFPTPTWADGIPMETHFAAYRECEALPNIRNKNNNPGYIKLELGRVYEVLEKDSYTASHYRLKIEEANPKQRWVDVGCGTLAQVSHVEDAYLFSAYWLPSYCENNKDKYECKLQHPERYDANNLTLHGLWPQPHANVYCGVQDYQVELSEVGDWVNLPILDLSMDHRENLATYMPGVASSLQRHQWTKHGTCYTNKPDTYFDHSLKLLLDLQASGLNDLFRENIGQEITLEQVQALLDEKLGEGAGQRVAMKCEDNLVTELWMSLKGNLATDDLETLVNNAQPVKRSCIKGRIDKVGFEETVAENTSGIPSSEKDDG